MAIMEEVRRPSVPMGVMNRWRLGVNRNGTDSLLKNSGLLGVMAVAESRVSDERTSREEKRTKRTGQHVRSEELPGGARDVHATRVASSHRHDIGHEDEGGHLQSHLLADLPQLTRARHRLDHVLWRAGSARQLGSSAIAHSPSSRCRPGSSWRQSPRRSLDGRSRAQVAVERRVSDELKTSRADRLTPKGGS